MTYSDEFEVFWKYYPKKKGKGQAEKAFKKALLQTTLNTILDAIVNCSRTEQWQKGNCVISVKSNGI